MHRLTHPEPQRDCFACKLQTLNFGIVPGASKDTSSTSMYDSESLREFPTREETNDRAATARRKLDEA